MAILEPRLNQFPAGHGAAQFNFVFRRFARRTESKHLFNQILGNNNRPWRLQFKSHELILNIQMHRDRQVRRQRPRRRRPDQ